MRKFLFIITKGDNIGGAQIYVKELAIQLKKDGHEVIVATGSEGVLTQKLKDNQIQTIILKNLEVSIHLLKDVKAVFELKKIIKQTQPDLVCINSSKSGFVGRIACYLAKTKNVFVVHGWSFTDGLPIHKVVLFKLLERMIKSISQYWICVSDFDYRLGLQSKVIQPSKTKVIKNGITDKHLPHINSLKLNVTQIVFIARHDYQKDHLTFFKAIQEIDNINVFLLGDGPLFEYNQLFAKKINIESKLQFLGFQKNVDEYLSKSDIFVLISNWEGFPISTLEAMSAELPIIVSNVGGAAEAIENCKEGFVVEKGDVKVLREKINYLINNPTKRVEMGKLARKKYETSFAYSKMYSDTFEYFEEIIKCQNRN